MLACALQLLLDEQGALEVVQRGLLQALRSPLLCQLSDQALGQFLDRLVVRLALSKLRAGARPGRESPPPLRFPGSSGRHALIPVTPPGSEPAERRLAPEIKQLDRLGQELQRLSPEARVTVTLVVMQGRSPREAADLVGCREESCRFWLNQGRKLLRRALQRDLLVDEPEPPSPAALTPTGLPDDLRRGKKVTARA
jgi:DNA-directed RNA polymerase specialized sigma24 family protein